MRYFVTCATLILLSVLTLGSALFVMAFKSSNEQKLDIYKPLSQLVASNIAQGDYSQRDLRGLMTLASTLGQADVYVVDSSGYSYVGISFRRGPTTLPRSVPQSIMKVLNKGDAYSNLGTFDGMFNSPYITYGYPIIGSSGTVYGAVFLMSRSDVLSDYLSGYLQMFIILAMIVLAVSFIVIYFVTSKLVRPLRQMSAAARSFGSGDFSKRVPVINNDEIGQLAFAFNNMANSLSTLEDMRRSFVANVSHELKTPMTSIAGFIDGILDGTIPPEKESYYLKIVSDEVKRLSRLVHSLLNIAKIEAGEIRINYTSFDVAEIIRRVVIGFERQIDQKRLDIRFTGAEDRVAVFSDPDLTHQIVYNLIENAVKFSNEGGSIEITLAEKNKKVYIGIRNTGLGIASGELPYVFDRFYKTDKSRGLDKKGIGLGLYIVKTILNLQQQDIVVKSEEGSYCEFVFTLKKS